jgi:hypothetical protein
MARRYIGDAVITITYHDAGDYRGTIRANGKAWRFRDLRAPVCFSLASDSPEAYDRMAAAAVSFGSYYTTDNRGPCALGSGMDEFADRGYPDGETADAIEQATGCSMDDRGRYAVSRSPNGPTRWNS